MLVHDGRAANRGVAAVQSKTTCGRGDGGDAEEAKREELALKVWRGAVEAGGEKAKASRGVTLADDALNMLWDHRRAAAMAPWLLRTTMCFRIPDFLRGSQTQRPLIAF
jgi:hypothetical protein